MQSWLFVKKVIKMTVQGSILEAFGVTLEEGCEAIKAEWLEPLSFKGNCRGIILVSPKGAKMIPRALKKVPK